MKTPTLIVRLTGLWLLVSCSLGLMQLHQIVSLARPVGTNVQLQSYTSSVQLYTIVGLITGLAATLFAGPLARLLTFDSEPKKEDLSERLLQSKHEDA